MTPTDINAFIAEAARELWGWPMIVLLLGTHLYLTIRLRFPQRHILRAIRLSVTRDDGAEGDVSQFGALATSLAATIGTGNIVGVATAVALGGPGAVLWCWLTGVLGIATKYASGSILDFIQLDNNYSIYEMRVPKEWVGKTLAQIDLRKKYRINVLTVRRGEEAFMPGPETVMQADDIAYVMGEMREIQKCFRI